MEDIIGRQAEIQEFERFYSSGKPEFIAVYGRRRGGKAFLVHECFEGQFGFGVVGLADCNAGGNLRGIVNREITLEDLVKDS